jgi:hypothetical protein
MVENVYIRNAIGIDNGSTGSIGVVGPGGVFYYHTPVKVEQDYTIEKKNVTRLDHFEFEKILKKHINKDTVILLERPLVNPAKFQTTLYAVRVFEAQLVVLDRLGLKRGDDYKIQDSRSWQKKYLNGVTGSSAKKQASFDIGLSMFPETMATIIKQGDADGLLLALYASTEWTNI